jgi:hypothetical protein
MPSGWVLSDLLTMEIKLRCIKSTVLGPLPLRNSKDPDRIKQSDPDPYQSEKHDLDPQHCPTPSGGHR